MNRILLAEELLIGDTVLEALDGKHEKRFTVRTLDFVTCKNYVHVNGHMCYHRLAEVLVRGRNA